jgi:hypothetical protein
MVVMRLLSVMTGVLLSTNAGTLSGQQPRAFHVHASVGGAATGGGGYQDNGGAFGRLGVDFGVRPGWFIEPNASFFVRLANGGCVGIGNACDNWFPGTVAVITFDAARLVSAAPFDDHPIVVSAGVGPAFVGSSTHVPSGTTFAGEGGAQVVLLGGRHAALTFDVHAILIANAHQRTLWLLPLTLGVAF